MHTIDTLHWLKVIRTRTYALPRPATEGQPRARLDKRPFLLEKPLRLESFRLWPDGRVVVDHVHCTMIPLLTRMLL